MLSTTNLLLLNDALLPAGDGEQGGFRLVVHLAILPSCAETTLLLPKVVA